MKTFDIYTFDFPGAGVHPVVILGEETRVANKPKINVLLCSTQRATRQAEAHEIILDESDGLDWPTICKCDLLYTAEKKHVQKKRGTVTGERRRILAEKLIRSLGLAGL